MAEAAGKRILVVDDANLVRRFYRDALERAGFEVDEAMNGVEALEKVLSEAFDLAIVDVNMPQMDGITFLKELRRLPPPVSSLPTLVISTEAGEQDAASALQPGPISISSSQSARLCWSNTCPSCVASHHERIRRTVRDRGPRAGRPGHRRSARP